MSVSAIALADNQFTPSVLTWKWVSNCFNTSTGSARFLVRPRSTAEGMGIRTGSSSGLAALASCERHSAAVVRCRRDFGGSCRYQGSYS
jgi:hypothetical protein